MTTLTAARRWMHERTSKDLAGTARPVRFGDVSLSGGLLAWRFEYYVRRESVSGAAAVLVPAALPRLRALGHPSGVCWLVVEHADFTIRRSFPAKRYGQAARLAAAINDQAHGHAASGRPRI
ncbi:hypothetical protein [Frigoribacterium faeni]|uniref:Uncharacterized protein n=1 Tax=Frigoribacterium faeni TaxID=145483 RepID=A0A7W3JG34_9MICO|nr:hypothetical protein [Frigoribacterium faeni]MBA8812227.1 hypothetical protein [Frigoribacterium faeni]BFF13263.1 hypothetical protein GCM10025699_45660 [Microbacterium flavescens]GEK83200.1 hypothetical protein FFA01_15090 [Frigoribacterium faeni]